MKNSVNLVCIITLGCNKNTVEAEYLSGSFTSKGFLLTQNIIEADIIVVHTCSFVGDARAESERAVEYALKIKKPQAKVYVTGCLPQLLGEGFISKFPDVSGFLGTGSTQKLPDLILRKKSVCDATKAGGFNDNSVRVLSSALDYAYLKIAEGCSHKCSFCVIPRIRGAYRSRTTRSLIEEAKTLAASGVKEIILIAQDTTSYGIDLYNRFSLSKLLENLCKVDGIKRIRLMYAYPSSITGELLKVIADNPQICNYIDVPVQHISQKMLKAQRRPLNTRDVIYGIIKKLPDITLRTTFITGFPGETEKDFKELLDFTLEGNFTYAGVFCYSDEAQALSYKLKGKVSAEIAQKRKIILEKAQQTVFERKIKKLYGRQAEVFVESCQKKGNKYIISGRLSSQAPEIDGVTVFESSLKAKLSSFKKVIITGTDGYNITARSL